MSLDSAAAAYARLVDLVGVVDPSAVYALEGPQLREAGFSRQKARYARELAARVLDGRLDLGGLARLDDDAVRAALTEAPGIGPWTADIFLMSCLGRPDVWPSGDRALQVATAEALGSASVPTAGELDAIGARWAPRRSAAAHILWNGYLTRRNRRAPANDLHSEASQS